jgi:hypothetical protein
MAPVTTPMMVRVQAKGGKFLAVDEAPGTQIPPGNPSMGGRENGPEAC